MINKRWLLWSFLKAIFIFLGYYFFSYVSSAGLSIGVQIKYLEIPEELSYILDPILASLLLNSLVAFCANIERRIMLTNIFFKESDTAFFISNKRNLYSIFSLSVFLLFSIIFPEHRIFVWLRQRAFLYIPCPLILQKLISILLQSAIFGVSLFCANKRIANQIKYDAGGFRKNNTKGDSVFKHLLKLVGIVYAYYIFGIIAPSFLMLIFGFVTLVIRMYYIPLILLMCFVINWTRKYLLYFSMRKKLFLSIKRICESKRYTISCAKQLLPPLLLDTGKINFEFCIGASNYSCLLISSLRKNNAYFLEEKSIVIAREYRILGRTIFRTFTHKALPIVSGKLILVFLPEIDNLYISELSSYKRTHLGNNVYSYLIYSDKMLIGNLERNSIK